MKQATSTSPIRPSRRRIGKSTTGEAAARLRLMEDLEEIRDSAIAKGLRVMDSSEILRAHRRDRASGP